MGDERGQSRGRERKARRQQGTAHARARLAVLAAIGVCLFAVFSILATSGGDDGAVSPETDQEQTSGQSTGNTDENGSTGGATKTTKSTYRVRAGDSFASISVEVGISVEELQQLNPDVDPRALQPGQKLKLR